MRRPQQGRGAGGRGGEEEQGGHALRPDFDRVEAEQLRPEGGTSEVEEEGALCSSTGPAGAAASTGSGVSAAAQLQEHGPVGHSSVPGVLEGGGRKEKKRNEGGGKGSGRPRRGAETEGALVWWLVRGVTPRGAGVARVLVTAVCGSLLVGLPTWPER